jgi:hypothetical protein
MLLLTFALACGGVDTVSADFQLDIIGANLNDTDRVRICVAGQAVHEEALGHGRIAVEGLSGPIEVSVHRLEDGVSLGHIEPITLSEAISFTETDWRQDDDALPCTVEQSGAHEGGSQFLAVRFVD